MMAMLAERIQVVASALASPRRFPPRSENHLGSFSGDYPRNRRRSALPCHFSSENPDHHDNEGIAVNHKKFEKISKKVMKYRRNTIVGLEEFI
ncbi:MULTISPECIES: hypothetical protein [unclassified Cupriavidus]|uniref:hypothetical protein n=1 Tax=unclassified Cupriavidus TaxID=2640874 RepID=UPI00313B1955